MSDDARWLSAIPVTVVGGKNAAHTDGATTITLYEALFEPLPGLDCAPDPSTESDEDRRGHHVYHFAAYASALDARLKKRACSRGCYRHEPGATDLDVDMKFGSIWTEIDLSPRLKREVAEMGDPEAWWREMVEKIVVALGQDAPNIIAPSPSWGSHFAWIPEEPITSPALYEGVIEHYQTLLGAAVEKAGFVRKGPGMPWEESHDLEVDPARSDWTGLWKCCRVRGWEDKRSNFNEPHKWKWYDTLATHAPMVLHDRRVPMSVIALIKVVEPVKKAPTLDPLAKARIARHPKKHRMKRALQYLRKVPPAITGENGSRDATRAAGVGHSFGLTQEETLDALCYEWNDRCEPPISEEELQRKVSHVWDTSDREWGWRLSKEQGGERADDEACFEGMTAEERAEAERDIEEGLRRMDAHWPDGTPIDGIAEEQAEQRPVVEEKPEEASEQAPRTEADYESIGAAMDLWKQGDGDGVRYDLALAYYRNIQKANAKTVGENLELSAKELKALLLPLPDPYDMLRLAHPHLICTVARGTRREWFEFDDAVGYRPVINVLDLVHRVLKDLRISPTSRGYTSQASAMESALGTESGLDGFEKGTPCLVEDDSVTPVVDEKTRWVLGGDRRVMVFDRSGSHALIDHTPRLYVSHRLGVDPEEGETPFTDAVLRTVFHGDQEKIDCFLDWLAYSLIPGNEQKRILLLVAEGGSGKTTLFNLASAFLSARNVKGYSDKALADPFVHGHLRTCLANFVEEVNPYGREWESMAKAATGGSPVTWAIKYGASGSYIPPWKLMLAMNDDPTLVDDSGAYAERLVYLRTKKIHAEDIEVRFEVGEGLTKRFEKERGALLQNVLARLPRVISKGITVPFDSVEAVHSLRSHSSPVLDFFEDCVEVEARAFVTRADLYLAYRHYSGFEKRMFKDVFLKKFRSLKEVRLFVSSGDVGESRPEKDGKRVRGFQGLRLRKGVLPEVESWKSEGGRRVG